MLKKYQQYLSEFVYGGMDGSVTTFAVVAGATGAHLESSIVIILGMSNLIADGFAMSVGSYLSAKTKKEQYNSLKEREYWEIENLRSSEVDEITAIFAAKGFEGKLLEQVVEKITENNDHWVDIMMKHELELVPENRKSVAIGMATFISFVLVGFIPLFIYIIDYFQLVDLNLFLISSILTFTVFIAIGFMKSYVNKTNRIKSILETLLLGSAAAMLAFLVGGFLERVIS